MRQKQNSVHLPVIVVDGEQLGNGETTSRKHNHRVQNPVSFPLHFRVLQSLDRRRSGSTARRRKPIEGELTFPRSETSHLTHDLGALSFPLQAHRNPFLLVRGVPTLKRNYVKRIGDGVRGGDCSQITDPPPDSGQMRALWEPAAVKVSILDGSDAELGEGKEVLGGDGVDRGHGAVMSQHRAGRHLR